MEDKTMRFVQIQQFLEKMRSKFQIVSNSRIRDIQYRNQFFQKLRNNAFTSETSKLRKIILQFIIQQSGLLPNLLNNCSPHEKSLTPWIKGQLPKLTLFMRADKVELRRGISIVTWEYFFQGLLLDHHDLQLKYSLGPEHTELSQWGK